MSHPHPLLAALGRAGMVAAAAYLLVAVGFTVLPMHPPGWYGSVAWTSWAGVTTAGQAWQVVRWQTETGVAAVAGPAAWLLVAWLLRQTATGRLALARPVGVARLPATVGMAVAVVGIAAGVVRWVTPHGADPDYNLPERLAGQLDEGKTFRFDAHRSPGLFAGSSFGHGWPQNPPGAARRLVATACAEGVSLFEAVSLPVIVLLAAGAVRCLTRTDAGSGT